MGQAFLFKPKGNNSIPGDGISIENDIVSVNLGDGLELDNDNNITISSEVFEQIESIATNAGAKAVVNGPYTLKINYWTDSTLTVTCVLDTNKRNVIDIPINELTYWGEYGVRPTIENSNAITFTYSSLPERNLHFYLTSFEIDTTAVSNDYISDGMIFNFKLDNDYKESVSNTTLSGTGTITFELDEDLNRTVGIFNGAGLCYNGIENFDTSNGFTLQCLVNIDEEHLSTSMVYLSIGKINAWTAEWMWQSGKKYGIERTNGGVFSEQKEVTTGWHLVALTYNNVSHAHFLYVDGELVASTTITMSSIKSYVGIGRCADLNRSDLIYPLYGKGCNFVMYNRPLTAAEIMENYEIDINRYSL